MQDEQLQASAAPGRRHNADDTRPIRDSKLRDALSSPRRQTAPTSPLQAVSAALNSSPEASPTQGSLVPAHAGSRLSAAPRAHPTMKTADARVSRSGDFPAAGQRGSAVSSVRPPPRDRRSTATSVSQGHAAKGDADADANAHLAATMRPGTLDAFLRGGSSRGQDDSSVEPLPLQEGAEPGPSKRLRAAYRCSFLHQSKQPRLARDTTQV